MKCPKCNEEINTEICEFCGYDTNIDKVVEMTKKFTIKSINAIKEFDKSKEEFKQHIIEVRRNLTLEIQLCKMTCWSLGITTEGFKALKNMEREIEGKPEIDNPIIFLDKNHRKKAVELVDKIVDKLKEEYLTPVPDFEKAKKDWINLKL